MVNRPLASRSGYALSTAVAGTLFSVTSIALSMVFHAPHGVPAYSLLNHFVSELGWSKHAHGAWLFNLGVAVAGAAWIPLLWEMGRHIGTVLGRVAGASGAITALAGSLVGLFPMNRIVPHLAIAGIYFSLLPVTMVLFDLAFLRSGERQEARWPIRASFIVLLAWLAFTVSPKDFLIYALQHLDTVVRPAVWGLALLEWTLLLAVGLWMLACTAYMVRRAATQSASITGTR